MPPAVSLRLLTAVAIVAGVARGWLARWVCDDAFVSFRYADNLVAGLGLVFNAGERVEGYSNFLWTMLLALGIAVGVDPVPWSQALGLAAFGGALLVLAYAAGQIHASAGRGRLMVPLAVLGAACHRHLAVFATSGLETALFTLLVTAAVVSLIRAETARGFLLAGLLGILATATRPDGALAYAGGSAVVLAIAVSQRSVRPLAAYAVPFVLLYLPYFAWKWSYYGSPLPNTFYAKSADQPYLEQGLLYLALYFARYWALLPALLAVPWLAAVRARRGLAPGFDTARAPLLIAAVVLPYLAFVAWVGGDFMFGRFLVPVTPLLLLAFELATARFARAQPWLALALCAGLLVGTPQSWVERLHGGETHVHEETEVYTRERVEDARRQGVALRELTRGLDVGVVVWGMQVMIGYWARFPVVVEGAGGLTDAHLARLPVAQRGRPGHEKSFLLALDYVVGRGIDFVLSHEGEVPMNVPPPLRVVWLGPMKVLVLTWHRETMRELRRRGVECPDFETELDAYIAALPTKTRADVARDFAVFEKFYFDHNRDPERERAFRQFLE